MPFTLTPALIRADVLERLGDTAQLIWSNVEIEDLVLEGYNRFCVGTKILWRRDRTSLSDNAGQAIYTLPGDLFELERVTWGDEVIQPTTRAELMYRDPQFELAGSTGDVISYLLEGDGLRTLRKIRTPTVTTPFKFAIEFTRRALFDGDRIRNGGFDVWTVASVPDMWVNGCSGLGASLSQLVPGSLSINNFAGTAVTWQDVTVLSGARRFLQITRGTGGNATPATVGIQNLQTLNYLQSNLSTWGVSPFTISADIASAYTIEPFAVTNTDMCLLRISFTQNTAGGFPSNTVFTECLEYPLLEIHDHYLKYVRFFTLWKALEREGPGQDIGAANHYRSRYERGVATTLARHYTFRKSLTNAIGVGGVGRSGIAPPSWPSNFGRTIRRRR